MTIVQTLEGMIRFINAKLSKFTLNTSTKSESKALNFSVFPQERSGAITKSGINLPSLPGTSPLTISVPPLTSKRESANQITVVNGSAYKRERTCSVLVPLSSLISPQTC